MAGLWRVGRLNTPESAYRSLRGVLFLGGRHPTHDVPKLRGDGGKALHPPQEQTMTISEPKYPGVEVQLTGTDGNAFAVMGAVVRALRLAGAASEDIKQYQDESMSGDYDSLLATAMRWVDVS